MIGMGVYTVSEAARYVDAHYATARSWFRGRPDKAGRGPVFDSDYSPIGGDYAISFLDLIDLLVATRFRHAGVDLPIIRRSYTILKSELNTDHPFCHGTLYTNGESIIVGTADEMNEQFHDAISRQMFFSELKGCLERIDYDETSRLAERWHISDGVTVDPTISFGRPVIEDTGTSASILARQFYANGEDAALVADLFNVSEEDVANAVRFEDRFGNRRAA
jgi:uncharacterized protein (DUF433 family)